MNNKEIINKIYNNLFLIQSLNQKIDEEINKGGFPSDTTNKLVKSIKEILNVISNHLKWRYFVSLQQEKDIDQEILINLEKNINLITIYIAFLSNNLKYILESKAPNTPWRIVEPMVRISKSLVDNSALIISTEWNFNYSYRPITNGFINFARSAKSWDPQLSSSLINIISQQPFFFTLSFPPITFNNYFYSAIWAHELGHLIDYNNEIFEENKPIDEHSLSIYVMQKISSNNKITIPEDLSELIDLDKSKNEKDRDKYLVDLFHSLNELLKHWAKEIFADIFSIHLMGPAALFANFTLLNSLTESTDKIAPDDKHPPLRLRLEIMLKTLDSLGARDNWLKYIPEDYKDSLNEYFYYLQERLDLPYEKYFISFNGGQRIKYSYVYNLFKHNLDTIISSYNEEINKIFESSDNCHFESEDFRFIFSTIKDLEQEIPPRIFSYYISGDYKNKYLSLILNTGWLYLINFNLKIDKPFLNEDRYFSTYENISSLLSKSIENCETILWFQKQKGQSGNEENEEIQESSIIHNSSGPNALSHNAIKSELDDNLVITPLLDTTIQIGKCALDIRLGNEFIVTKLPAVTHINPIDLNYETKVSEFQSKIYKPLGDPFVLHPGQFVLGSTLEYIVMPDHLMSIVLGRSSWGRLGLIIATASKVDPGFKGCITLELTNLGNIPIFLYPASRIGQLVFYKLTDGK